MMTSSYERREVAERLRDNNHGYGTEYDFFLHALGMPREGRGPCDWGKVHKRLADLIDPATSTTTFTPEESPIPLPVRLWVCARCGEEVIMMNDEGEPMACPYCKAVVADDD